jgi:hypothetical protein
MLVTFLQDNVDVFAWQPSQMPGIPGKVIELHLKIYPDAILVQQKPPGSSLLSDKTLSVKNSRSCSTLASYGRPKNIMDLYTQSS